MKRLLWSLELTHSLSVAVIGVLYVALTLMDCLMILLGLWLAGVDVAFASLWSWGGAALLVFALE